MLKLPVEQRIAELGLNDAVLAYRRMPGGKCNIHFADEAFNDIRRRGSCSAIAVDVEKFFDTLDHSQLKQAWCELLQVDRLPPDHYAVFRSLTRYSKVAKEAEEKGFLIADEGGTPINFANRGGWPSFLLNFEDPQAIDWYLAQCQKWLDAGVDGFKEDLMFYLDGLERDDKVDEVNRRLSENGVVIMLRNNYLGSPGDLHRYNDFNFYESQDRGPINGLCLSYSGFPYVYPDIVGGTKVWTEMEKNNVSPDVVATYMMRYAEYAAVHPSMSFGYGPWSLGRKDVVEITREAALLHQRLHPYIYSYALKVAETGFPYTMTPLPLA